ncbi:MAG: hypothetical protein VX589_18670 [Myxococcota bacterium]|nr:hypothetical protein [Myxococcota bacterium]
MKYLFVPFLFALPASAQPAPSADFPVVEVRGRAQFDYVKVASSGRGWQIRYRLLDDLGVPVPAQTIDVHYPNEAPLSLLTDAGGTARHWRAHHEGLPRSVHLIYRGSPQMAGATLRAGLPSPSSRRTLSIEAPQKIQAFKPFMIKANLTGQTNVRDTKVAWSMTLGGRQHQLSQTSNSMEVRVQGLPAGLVSVDIEAQVARTGRRYRRTVPIRVQQKPAFEVKPIGWRSDGSAFVVSVRLSKQSKYQKHIVIKQGNRRIVSTQTRANAHRLILPRSSIDVPGSFQAMLVVDHPDWMESISSFRVDTRPPALSVHPLNTLVQLALGSMILIGLGVRLGHRRRRPPPSMPDEKSDEPRPPLIQIDHDVAPIAGEIRLRIVDRRTNTNQSATIWLFPSTETLPENPYERPPPSTRCMHVDGHPFSVEASTSGILVRAPGFAPLLAPFELDTRGLILRLMTPREAAEDIFTGVLVETRAPQIAFGYDTPADAGPLLIKQGVSPECAHAIVSQAERLCFGAKPPTIDELADFEDLAMEARRRLRMERPG